MKKLPIDNFKNQIIRTVKENSITIIEGTTGCGKSSKVPIYLAEEGYKVLITQPRILAAISLSKNVANQYDNKICGNKVGYHTGLERCYSEDTQIMFLTEGTELIRQLASKETLTNTVLILDEFHEASINVDVLLAFAKKLIEDGKKLKLIIMSATLHSDNLSRFLHNAPVIKISSTLYNVDFIHSKACDIESIIYSECKRHRNILVFLPGKREILDLRKRLIEHFKSYGIENKILVLHSELTYEEQRLVFYHYPVPKIILATDIAQTSITINDIDVVVDIGLGKKMVVVDGIPQLVTKNISVSDCMQRKGRAGRCQYGKYYLCSDFKYENREIFATPEILTSSLENILLTLIRFNVDIKSLDLFHIPDNKNIEASIDLLRRLEALTDENEITEIGLEMSKYPLDCRSSRMMVEAKKYGVETDVLICCLIMQIGTIQSQLNETRNASINSDLIYELELFKSVFNSDIISNPKNYPYIHINNYKKILAYIDKILPILEINSITSQTTPDVLKIKKCIIKAYSDCIFIYKDKIGYLNNSYSKPRFLYSRSIIYSKKCKYLIGYPMDFSDNDSIYRRILFPTEYTLDELLENNEELFLTVYSLKDDEVYKSLHYNGIEIASLSIGSIADLKELDPLGFHEETEYYPKFKQNYISIYYHDLKISSKIVTN